MATYDSDGEVNNVNGQMQNERPDPGGTVIADRQNGIIWHGALTKNIF